MEDNSNSIDNTAILKELQKINKGINDVDASQKELIEYLIAKDLEEKEEAEKAEEKNKEAEEKAAEEKAAESKSAETRSAEQTEMYTEMLSDGIAEMRLNNELMAGSFMFYGIICGILLFKILWDKLA